MNGQFLASCLHRAGVGTIAPEAMYLMHTSAELPKGPRRSQISAALLSGLRRPTPSESCSDLNSTGFLWTGNTDASVLSIVRGKYEGETAKDPGKHLYKFRG